MVNNDLIIAIKNALERGQHVEQAVLSLVNAGYPREEVEEASRQVHLPVQQRTFPLPIASLNQPQQNTQERNPKKIILAIILLGIVALSVVASLIFFLLK